MAYQDREGPLARLRDRFVQAILREPAVVLFERDADSIATDPANSPRDRQHQEACA